MNKFNHYLAFFLGFFLLFSCQQNNTEISDASMVDEPPKDRNMFGLYIPRGLTHTSDNLTPGYVLFAVPNSAFMYLLDRQGAVVHEWKGNYGVSGGYLVDDGSLIQMAVDPDFPVFAGGGESGRLQKISWDGKMLWDFEYATEEYHAHHDIAVMPNGNILSIAWEAKTPDEAKKAGRKSERVPEAGVWPDKIVEIKPQGKRKGEVVWEWHMWDHMIQDHDPNMDNYGNPADHPELLDINMGRPLPEPITQEKMDSLHAAGEAWRNQTVENRGSDIYHVNAINYNQELDQIVFSLPSLNEIFIIDHSTTIEEAAGHTGGKQEHGGDILYRWGNPKNYQRGDSTDQKLFGQHDVRWVENEKPGAGNLTIFNNDIPLIPDSLDYSAIYEITPPTDAQGNYMISSDQPFGPQEPTWQYMAPDTLSFFASFISGAHRMHNGHTFINEGPKARFFEVTPDGEIVWEYLNQYRGEIRFPNGDPKPEKPFTYWGFRSTFIPADHPGLVGRDLKPLDPQPEVFKLPPPDEKEEDQ